MFNIFGWFRKTHDMYDESSDCFDAMKVALEQYEEEYGWLQKHRKESPKQIKKEEINQEHDKPGTTTRYSLQYLYSHKK